MSASRTLLLTLIALAACHSNGGRQRYPISGTTPVTDDERAQFIAHAEKLGCRHEKAPSGEDSVFCPQEVGGPRFIWLKEGGMACGVKRREQSCTDMWKRLNTP